MSGTPLITLSGTGLITNPSGIVLLSEPSRNDGFLPDSILDQKPAVLPSNISLRQGPQSKRSRFIKQTQARLAAAQQNECLISRPRGNRSAKLSIELAGCRTNSTGLRMGPARPAGSIRCSVFNSHTFDSAKPGLCLDSPAFRGQISTRAFG
jgi:hypothetical protein